MTTEVAKPTFGGFPITSAADMADTGYCILLYSKGGGGKTTLAGAADDSPEDKPVLFIDAEGGTKAISHRADVQVISVTSWDKIKELTNKIVATPELPWKTIVLDNLSEFIQLAINKIVGNATDQTTLPKYGEMAREVLALVRTYRDLARLRGVNTIIIAWDSPETDKAGRPLLTLNATPKLQGDLPGIVDIIGYISPIDNNPDKRILSFKPSTRTINKFRRNTSDAGKTIPHEITYGVDNLPMKHILAALKRGVEFPVDLYKEQPATTANRSS